MGFCMIIDFKQIKNAIKEKVSFDYEVDLSNASVFNQEFFKNPVSVTGEITNHLGIIKLLCKCQTTLEAECGRCLKPISPAFEFTIDQVLSTTPTDDFDDTFVILTDRLDLDEIVIPAIVLEVDMNYLCSEDCKGLCSKCGTDLNENKCQCDTRVIDPRLAVLQQLLDKD